MSKCFMSGAPQHLVDEYRNHTLRSALLANSSSNPLTPRTLVLETAFALGIPYSDSMHAGVMAVLEQFDEDPTFVSAAGKGVKASGSFIEEPGKLMAGETSSEGKIRARLHDSWMHEVKVTIEGIRNGITHRPYHFVASFEVLVHREVGVEELVGLANRDRNSKHIPSRGNDRSIQTGLI